MRASVLLAAVGLLSTSIVCLGHADEAEPLLEKIGTPSGLVVLLGDDLAPKMVDLTRKSHLTIYLQTANARLAERLRGRLANEGSLGRRVYVDYGSAERIHLADNLADAVILGKTYRTDQKPLQQELMRVLRPGGRLIEAARVIRKPVPKGSGEWTHPYHGADNNPQSEDTLARAPYLTQFLATPWYGPMPEITLSAGGRMFKAFGHLAFKQREWAMLGKLICMNGHNGFPLWQRDLEPGFMIHRSTLVATPDVLYVGQNQSCQRIDAATGKEMDRIVIDAGGNLVDSDDPNGQAWKWMTLRDGVLYALVGPREKLHPVHRGTRQVTGWPWKTVRETYGDYQTSWGFGQTLLAIDVANHKVLWTRKHDQLIDGRAICMNDDRIFAYSHRNYLEAIDIQNGQPLWRTTGKEVMDAIGEHDRAQDPRLGYATSAYLKCNNEGLYFAGPQRHKLVAVSASDGKLLWTHEDGNVQLVLRDDGLYAMGRMNSSKKFDYLSGKVLAELECFRGNCTRATGTADSIFARGYRHSGTLRYDVGYATPRRLPAMRPACQDGVVVANGLLYWGPWMCDCNHSLVGVVSLGSAGDFEFDQRAKEDERLQFSADADNRGRAKVESNRNDWPTYRADNRRSASSSTTIPTETRRLWSWRIPPALRRDGESNGLREGITAPTAVGEFVFVAGDDGSVWALDSTTGKPRWTAATGGRIFYPPTFEQGRLFVGSGDGWVYALDAASGKRAWRFRAAPVERKLPVYGRLMSTWPVASGVLAEDGVVYAAAGIVSHDGTHLYALDSANGSIRWQNNTSGNLGGEREVVGVSVQGHLLLDDGKLYMAGGNVVSPAIYNLSDGRCLNQLTARPETSRDDHWKMERSSRGSELYLAGQRVVVGGRMLYSPDTPGPASRYNANYLLQAGSDVVVQGNDQLVMRIDPKLGADGKARVIWQRKELLQTAGLALAGNAVVVAGLKKQGDHPPRPVLMALNVDQGTPLWEHYLPAPVRPWGLAIDRQGQVLVSLTSGSLVCYGN